MLKAIINLLKLVVYKKKKQKKISQFMIWIINTKIIKKIKLKHQYKVNNK